MRKTLLTGALLAMALHTFAQVPFTPLDTNFNVTTVIIPPSPLKYDVLFVGNHDYVHINGGTDSALAKQNHDFTGFIPEKNGKRRGWLIVNHELTNTKNPKLGDGGGQTSFKVRKRKGHWEVLPSIGDKKFHNVDFSTVGGTNTNCGGAHTPYGTTLTAEEYPQASNLSLWANGNGFQDTSDYTIPNGNGPYSGLTIKKYQNMGWMVEANPRVAKGIKKYYSMGRFSHEGGYCMPDGKTVYLTDDFTPGILFKFVASKANDYTKGQLYAYKQGDNGVGGSWIALPMDLESLINIRDIAVEKGASVFVRLEWVELAPNGKVYIAETGSDFVDLNAAVANGGVPAYHNMVRDTMNGQPRDNKYNDYYGRVLELDPATDELRVYLEGGNSADMKTNLASPDGLASVHYDGKDYLVINEDLNGLSMNRVPAGVTKAVSEIYYVDLSIQNPTVDDLHRFVIGPFGAETTGGVFTPDGNTYFVNIQHPSSTNVFPFNNSTTIAISGFDAYIRQSVEAEKTARTIDLTTTPAVDEAGKESVSFQIYPNPASRELHFNKTTDVSVYTAEGQVVKVERGVKTINIADLDRGIYYIQTTEGEVQKLVIE